MTTKYDIATNLITTCAETASACLIPLHKTITNENGVSEPARRFAYRVLSDTGHTPGISIYNSCQNNQCVNPEHMFQPNDNQAFMRRVKIQPNGCWEFSSVGTNGYGTYEDPATRKTVLAHRYSYQLHKGDIPAGMRVMHSCDNRACVCPGHLSTGTAKDNTQDMVLKGRSTKGRKTAPKRFTDQEKADIVSLSVSGVSQYKIAKKYGRAEPTIAHVLRKHKPIPKPISPSQETLANAA